MRPSRSHNRAPHAAPHASSKRLAHKQAAAPPSFSVDWEGDIFQHHSLSLVNQALCSRLIQRGIDVAVQALDAPPLNGSAFSSPVPERNINVTGRSPTITVRHSWPPRFDPRPPSLWAHIQPWEFGGVPDTWVSSLQHADEVWAPSTWVRDNYIASGLSDDKVQLVPNGVDTTLFTPYGPRYPLSTQKAFRFLFIGGLIARKGIDLLLRAYMDAFSPNDDVCLVIKGFGSNSVYANGLYDMVRSLCASQEGPAIELIEADLSQNDMASLYRSCDVLVRPYRGEGFALPVVEAMASGVPVVVTADGATADFCDDSDAWLLPSRRQTLRQVGGVGPSRLGYWMAEPDLGYLTNLLRELPNLQAESAIKAKRARDQVVHNYSWDKVVDVVEARLRNMAANSTSPAFRDRRNRSTGPTSAQPYKDYKVNSHAGLPTAPKVLLSACLIVKDEEKTLPDCLESLHRVVDEVVVYDTGSSDGTVALAKRAGARVFQGYWDNDFSRARNAALEQCSGDWVLWVDADEHFVCDAVPRLRGLLAQLGRAEEPDALLVDIYNFGGDGSMLGNVHRAFRIFRKSACCWYGMLHEQVDLRPALASSRSVKAAVLEGAHIDHYGYLDKVIRERDKLARNLRLAEAALESEPLEGQEGMPQLNFARSLAALGRCDEAQPHFEAALALAHEGVQRRTVLLHLTQNLLTLERYVDVLRYTEMFRQASKKTGLVDYLEGVARRRLGQLDDAIGLFERAGELVDDNGFAYPEAMLHAELAAALVDAGRPADAAEHLVKLVGEGHNVLAMTAALKIFASTGKPPEELAAAMPEDDLDKVGAALLLVPPVVAAPVAEALYARLGPRPALLAAAIRFAPALPVLQALEWSARLRAIGMSSRCPLLSQAQTAVLDTRDRVRAALTAHAAFGDPVAASLALDLAPGVPLAQLAAVLAEVTVLDPPMTPDFARAVAGPGAPAAGPVGSPDGRRDAVATALRELGYGDLAEQIKNGWQDDDPTAPFAAQVEAVAADR
ncbi:MAG: glycosyltransferase [Acidimicrobiales bacterium]